MSEIKIDQSQASIGVAFSKNTSATGQIAGTIHNYSPEQKQNLAEAAAEIQKLLEQLAENYPTETLTQKAAVAEEALQIIESNHTLKQRVVSAIQAMSVEALMQLIDHPVASILREGIERFREPS
jgi:phosphoenolpyruvate-protein kinase (PTS system EI component)